MGTSAARFRQTAKKTDQAIRGARQKDFTHRMRTSPPPASGPIIVIGHINHDRIWRLNAPLRSGARISWSDRRVRLGGGGYYTARRLMDLGHSVCLVSTLKDDRYGVWARDVLARQAYDLTHVGTVEGETECADILLEPNGERTILSDQKRASRGFSLSAPVKGRAFYVNGARLCDAILQSLEQASLVVSQFPLGTPTPRPADIIVGSKADFPGESLEQIWQKATKISGPRLRQLALTDGPRAITLFDGIERRDVHAVHPVSSRDTIGAGDSFSAALLHALVGGETLAEAAEWAGKATADWLRQRDACTGTDWADEPSSLSAAVTA